MRTSYYKLMSYMGKVEMTQTRNWFKSAPRTVVYDPRWYWMPFEVKMGKKSKSMKKEYSERGYVNTIFFAVLVVRWMQIFVRMLKSVSLC